MTQKQRVTKNEAARLAAAKRAIARRSRVRAGKLRRKPPKPTASKLKRQALQLHTMKIADFYRPLKKPVTLRLDADVLAWFKKDGRRYQTRINAALRKVMEREMKAAGT
jgi:uncharacterized protein (DUF4415 family)